MRAIVRGDVSKRRTRAVGSCRQLSTLNPVMISPPTNSRYRSSALAIDCEPPLGIGQPYTWATADSTRPIAALLGLESGRTECPALPANKARAFVDEKASFEKM